MAGPSPHTLLARIVALEARVGDTECPDAGSLYQPRRAAVRNDLRMVRLLERFGLDDVTDEEIDAVLDEEAPR